MAAFLLKSKYPSKSNLHIPVFWGKVRAYVNRLFFFVDVLIQRIQCDGRFPRKETPFIFHTPGGRSFDRKEIEVAPKIDSVSFSVQDRCLTLAACAKSLLEKKIK